MPDSERSESLVYVAIDTLRIGVWGFYAEGPTKTTLQRFAVSLHPGTCIKARIGETLCQIRRMKGSVYRLCVTPQEGPADGLSVLVMPEPDLARSSRMPAARVVFDASWCRALGLLDYDVRAKHAASLLGINAEETFLTGIDLAADLPLDRMDGFVTAAEHIAGRARGFVVTGRDGAVVSVANAARRSRAPRSATIYQAAGRPVRVEMRLHRAYLRTHEFTTPADLTPTRIHALWSRLSDEYVRVVLRKERVKARETLHPLWPAVQAACVRPDVLAAYDAQAHLLTDPSIVPCLEEDGCVAYVDRTTGEVLAMGTRGPCSLAAEPCTDLQRLLDADESVSGAAGHADIADEDSMPSPVDVPSLLDPKRDTPRALSLALASPAPAELYTIHLHTHMAKTKAPLTPAERAAKRQRTQDLLDFIDRRCRGQVDAYMSRRGYRRRGFYYTKLGAKSVKARQAEEYCLKDVWDFENPPPPPPPPFLAPWEMNPALVLRSKVPRAKETAPGDPEHEK